MVPIHDTDIAEERWSRAEWKHFELWEKIESKLRRRKWLWITGTVLLFLGLSSVPIIMDRWPKWRAMSLSRLLAQEVNRLKRDAAINHEAYRIRFAGDGSLAYTVERSEACRSPIRLEVRSGLLGGPETAAQFALLKPAEGELAGIPGLVESFCYDDLSGAESATPAPDLLGFAILPVKDLAEKRADRLSILLLKGASAEISFE